MAHRDYERIRQGDALAKMIEAHATAELGEEDGMLDRFLALDCGWGAVSQAQVRYCLLLKAVRFELQGAVVGVRTKCRGAGFSLRALCCGLLIGAKYFEKRAHWHRLDGVANLYKARYAFCL